MNKFITFLEKQNRYFIYFASFIAMVMMLLITVDVVIRPFGKAIISTYELVQFMMSFVVAFGFAYTELKGGHISIDILTSHFPKGVQRALNTFIYFVGVILFAVMLWQLASRGIYVWQKNDASTEMGIPTAYSMWIISFGFFLLCIALLLKFIRSLMQEPQP